jgi:hypothetical protein
MELISKGYIIRAEKDKLVAGKAWDDEAPYLKPLYEIIVSLKKPKDSKGVAEVYALGFGQKPFDELFSALGVSLVQSGRADEFKKKGLLKEKTRYTPKEEAFKSIIEKIRAEFLESETITAETLSLTVMLDKSGLIRKYFSKDDAKAIKKRVKEAPKSDEYVLAKETLDYIDGSAAACVASMYFG